MTKSGPEQKHTEPVAVHLLVLKGQQVLLMQRHNTGYEDGNFGLPSGHLELGENVVQAMIREAKEEINLNLNTNNLEIVQVMHRRATQQRVDYFFATVNYEDTIANMEAEKCSQLVWANLNALPVNTIPYIKYAIDNYLLNEKFTLFGWEKS